MQAILDRAAISLSVLCAIHCLAFPLTLVLLPSLVGLSIDDEAFHFWMVLAVLPTSTYALVMGCKKHKHYQVVIFGALGLLLLVSAVLLSESYLSELGEKTLTLIGASIIAFSHYRNYTLCRQNDSCGCSENSSTRETEYGNSRER